MEDSIDALFDQMIAQQRSKVAALARALDPHLTPDDLLSPQDFPQLAADPRFSYEDGILAGLISAQVAVRAQLRRGRA